ncbi:MAG: UDP-glucose 4-epimerase GalE [Hyphomonadaceae bacterium]|nr:UDP-glucose 4-epimerase GalE [Hyphomonadaceae bacterium]
MKILVTGGCGYIGSHVVWALVEAGYDVIILDDLSTGHRSLVPEKARIVVGDVGESHLLDQLFTKDNVEAVIHLAGKILPQESIANPLLYYRENLCKSVALISSMLRHNVHRIIFSSTAAVYGSSQEALVTEASPTKPISPYGQSKLSVELVLASASVAHNLQATVLRYFNVAGADPSRRSGPLGANPGHLIRAAIDVAMSRQATLRIFGNDYPTADGTCVRDFIHVSDLASAHVAALAALIGQEGYKVLNCGYGRGASVLEVVDAVSTVIGRRIPTEDAPRRPGDPPALIADASELRRVTAWRPSHDSLEEIIRSALSWEVHSAGIGVQLQNLEC